MSHLLYIKRSDFVNVVKQYPKDYVFINNLITNILGEVLLDKG